MRLMALAFLLASTLSAGGVSGTWTLETAQDQYLLRLTQSGTTAAVSTELPASALFFPASSLQSPGMKIHGTLQRDAGTFVLSGVVEAGGRARGRFEFSENLLFVEELMVIAARWWDARSSFEHAVSGVSLWQVRAARELGARRLSAQELADVVGRLPAASTATAALPSTDRDAPRKAQFRTTSPQTQPAPDDPESVYLRALRQTGFPLFRSDAERLKGHGVSPEMLRQLKLSGYDVVSVSDMVRLQNHGVTQHDLQLLELQGKRNLTVDDIVKAKVNGIR